MTRQHINEAPRCQRPSEVAGQLRERRVNERANETDHDRATGIERAPCRAVRSGRYLGHQLPHHNTTHRWSDTKKKHNNSVAVTVAVCDTQHATEAVGFPPISAPLVNSLRANSHPPVASALWTWCWHPSRCVLSTQTASRDTPFGSRERDGASQHRSDSCHARHEKN